ncbi:MAG: hypothetical protein JXA71_07465 [Chitinispirillaceae bacterium]|nr:hypothetical protein [Chitinispirillaceae bacterium]
MTQHIVLIDYENVQAIDLGLLKKHGVIIKVFHAKGQKFTGDFLKNALEFGKPSIDVIEMTGSGRNALDFHLAYYIGRLSKETEQVAFHIISKDKGFLPLIDHIRSAAGISCTLSPSIGDLPFCKAPVVEKTATDRFAVVRENLMKSKAPRPKRKKTLCNQIKTLFKKEIADKEVEDIVRQLVEGKIISINNERIEYRVEAGI